MKKKIFTFLLFLFLSSCGYEAIYSVKNRTNYSFSISELTLTGDRQTNLRIKQNLNRYSNPNIEEGKSFALDISSSSEKIITTKDAAGDAVKFKNEIKVKVQVFMNGQYKSNFDITETFIYDNNSNTSELRAYENQIKNNLAGSVVDKIVNKLSQII
tara:strand:+ start:281 stop:751 length:471 start_codon:yes stop_codon:yes gene_type:complete